MSAIQALRLIVLRTVNGCTRQVKAEVAGLYCGGVAEVRVLMAFSPQVTCAALGLALALHSTAATAPAQGTSALSFARDVAPLVARHCAPCHRDDGDAPFSLTTAGDVRARAATIAAVVGSRYMPPWKPEPGYGEFHAERRLPDADMARIVEWAGSGAAIDVPAGTSIAGPTEPRG